MPKDSVVEPWDRGDRPGSSVWSRWGRNGINDIRFRRSAKALDPPWGRRWDAVMSPYTPCKCHQLQQHSCGDHMRPRCMRTGSRGALGDLTVLLLRCRCDPQRSHGTHSDRRGKAEPQPALCACTKCAPWHGVLGDPTASSGDATAIPRHSTRSHCTPLGVLRFFCAPCSRHEHTTLVWQELK